MTSLLREEVTLPIADSASSTSTSMPASAKARAVARPITPAPATTTSTRSKSRPSTQPARKSSIAGNAAGSCSMNRWPPSKKRRLAPGICRCIASCASGRAMPSWRPANRPDRHGQARQAIEGVVAGARLDLSSGAHCRSRVIGIDRARSGDHFIEHRLGPDRIGRRPRRSRVACRRSPACAVPGPSDRVRPARAADSLRRRRRRARCRRAPAARPGRDGATPAPAPPCRRRRCR